MTSELAKWSRGDWMQTYTGKRFYPRSPRTDEIDDVDIAHALSLLCRYTASDISTQCSATE